YYPISTDSSIADTVLMPGAAYSLNLDATVIDRPVLHTLLPGINTLHPITLSAAITDTNIAVLADVPNLSYNDMLIDSGRLRINNTSDSTLSYAVTVNNFSQNTLQLWYSSITGTVQQQHITTDVVLRDIEKEDRFGLSAALSIDSTSQTLSLRKDLLLNYEEWAVNPANKITLGKN